MSKDYNTAAFSVYHMVHVHMCVCLSAIQCAAAACRVRTSMPSLQSFTAFTGSLFLLVVARVALVGGSMFLSPSADGGRHTVQHATNIHTVHANTVLTSTHSPLALIHHQHSPPALTHHQHSLTTSTHHQHSPPARTHHQHSLTHHQHSPPALTTSTHSPPALTTSTHSPPALTHHQHSLTTSTHHHLLP